MSARHTQGGASALPIARAFLATGGRFIISPEGKLEAIPDLSRIYESTLHPLDPREARRAHAAARRLFRRLRNPRFARSVKCMVLMDGERTHHGWQVLRGEA
jgi:hypothetical protein